jgi:hypothetical protein
MDEDTSLTSQAEIVEPSPKTLIDKLRQDYRDAIQLCDVQSGEEVRSGHEMKGVMTFMTAASRLSEIHEQL